MQVLTTLTKRVYQSRKIENSSLKSGWLKSRQFANSREVSHKRIEIKELKKNDNPQQKRRGFGQTLNVIYYFIDVIK